MPLDFTGNDPNKFQDVQQYAPGDPRAAIAAAEANFQNVTANAPGPIPEMPTRPDGGFTDSGQVMDYRNAMRAHNQALDDAKNYAQTSKYFHDTLHEAQVQADAGAFHTDFAHVGMDDPDLQDKAAALLAKHPGAASDPSVLHSLNMKLNANAKHLAINESNAKQEESYQEKASKVIAAGKADGSLADEDFPVWDGKSAMPKYLQRNPRTGNITYNLDYVTQLSAAKKAAGYGTKAETQEMTLARNTQAVMAKALADSNLADDDPRRAMYQQAHDAALQTIATGTAPGQPVKKGAAIAPASKPAASWVVSLHPKTP